MSDKFPFQVLPFMSTTAERISDDARFRALVDYAGQLDQDDLLPTRLPDKVQKPKWAKPRKTHGKASARSYTGAEAAELAADQAEQRSRLGH